MVTVSENVCGSSFIDTLYAVPTDVSIVTKSSCVTIGTENLFVAQPVNSQSKLIASKYNWEYPSGWEAVYVNDDAYNDSIYLVPNGNSNTTVSVTPIDEYGECSANVASETYYYSASIPILSDDNVNCFNVGIPSTITLSVDEVSGNTYSMGS